MIRGLRIPDCEARQAWLERRRRTRRTSFASALFVWPVRSVGRRIRARYLEASLRRGRPVTVRMARRERPQDIWASGKLATAAGPAASAGTAGSAGSSGTAASAGWARWRTLCGCEWFPLAERVADRLVGDARQGAVVFSLRDGTEVSVNAVYARVARAALAAGPGADAHEG